VAEEHLKQVLPIPLIGVLCEDRSIDSFALTFLPERISGQPVANHPSNRAPTGAGRASLRPVGPVDAGWRKIVSGWRSRLAFDRGPSG
jgi:hypothetical protein